MLNNKIIKSYFTVNSKSEFEYIYDFCEDKSKFTLYFKLKNNEFRYINIVDIDCCFNDNNEIKKVILNI